jgi:hypothetical protein
MSKRPKIETKELIKIPKDETKQTSNFVESNKNESLNLLNKIKGFKTLPKDIQEYMLGSNIIRSNLNKTDRKKITGFGEETDKEIINKECKRITYEGKKCRNATIYHKPKNPKMKIDCKDYCFSDNVFQVWLKDLITNVPTRFYFFNTIKKKIEIYISYIIIKFSCGNKKISITKRLFNYTNHDEDKWDTDKWYRDKWLYHRSFGKDVYAFDEDIYKKIVHDLKSCNELKINVSILPLFIKYRNVPRGTMPIYFPEMNDNDLIWFKPSNTWLSNFNTVFAVENTLVYSGKTNFTSQNTGTIKTYTDPFKINPDEMSYDYGDDDDGDNVYDYTATYKAGGFGGPILIP